MRVTDTESFIKKADRKHGGFYDYSKVDYKGTLNPVIIICPKHGEFLQTPGSHLAGSGCTLCGLERRREFAKARRRTTLEYLADVRKVHGDYYDYSKTVYEKSTGKVTITCPKHGDFEQTAYSHRLGAGCPECGIEKRACPGVRSTLEGFINKAKSIHGDTYTYEKVRYVNSSTKVTITCPKHGDFDQRPNAHLNGSGCQVCAEIRRGTSNRKDQNHFLQRAKAVHGDRYDYSKTVYVRSTEKVIITCKKHGDFLQTPCSHTLGRGCPECGKIKMIESRAKQFSNQTSK